VSYTELPPPAALRDLVDSMWVVSAEAGGPASIVPDGCMDILHGHTGRLSVAGSDTTAHQVHRPAGTSAVGVRFRPGALPRLLGVPANELRDMRVPLEDVAPRLARSLARLDDDALSPAERLALIVDAVARRDAAPADPVVDGAVAALSADPRRGVRELAAGVSERHLRRRFHVAVGYGPKTLARVLRFRRLLGLPREDLALMALEAGYADQAHMTNEVKRLAGVTPSVLLRG
jgi:hypothetical protein